MTNWPLDIAYDTRTLEPRMVPLGCATHLSYTMRFEGGEFSEAEEMRLRSKYPFPPGYDDEKNYEYVKRHTAIRRPSKRGSVPSMTPQEFMCRLDEIYAALGDD